MPFEIVRNDITKMRVDAIVNAANRSLLGGGGVDGAIHRAAGPELLNECRTLGGCETGEAKITKGYRLPAKYVIHTVGPIWYGGGRGEPELLSACYRNSLDLASAYGCESVAFPLISAGAYGYPPDQAMSVAIDAIGKFLFDHDMTVFLVVFGRDTSTMGKKLFRDVQEYIDDVYVDEHLQKNVESERRRFWQRRREPDELQSGRIRRAPRIPDFSEAPRYSDADRSLEDDDAAGFGSEEFCGQTAMPVPDWKDMLKRTDESFSEALLRMIDERGMTDSQCYKRANVDRRLFSKIRSDPAYRPSKPTAFAFAVALELSLQETEQLLRKAGFAISHSSRFDIVLEYFIKARNYDIFEINEVLFEFDMPLLGSVVSV